MTRRASDRFRNTGTQRFPRNIDEYGSTKPLSFACFRVWEAMGSGQGSAGSGHDWGIPKMPSLAPSAEVLPLLPKPPFRGDGKQGSGSTRNGGAHLDRAMADPSIVTLTPPTVFCAACSVPVVAATAAGGKVVRLDEAPLGPLMLVEAYPGAPPMAAEATEEPGTRRYDLHRCKCAKPGRLFSIAPLVIAPLSSIAEVNA